MDDDEHRGAGEHTEESNFEDNDGSTSAHQNAAHEEAPIRKRQQLLALVSGVVACAVAVASATGPPAESPGAGCHTPSDTYSTVLSCGLFSVLGFTHTAIGIQLWVKKITGTGPPLLTATNVRLLLTGVLCWVGVFGVGYWFVSLLMFSELVPTVLNLRHPFTDLSTVESAVVGVGRVAVALACMLLQRGCADEIPTGTNWFTSISVLLILASGSEVLAARAGASDMATISPRKPAGEGFSNLGPS